jgi:hypothetical protein
LELSEGKAPDQISAWMTTVGRISSSQYRQTADRRKEKEKNTWVVKCFDMAEAQHL